MYTSNGSSAQGVRRSERVRAHVPVTLIWHEHEHRQTERTYTAAVSRFGCLVLCRCNLPPGTAIRIEHDRKVMLGKISYCLKDCATKLVELGIAFDEDGTDFWGVGFDA